MDRNKKFILKRGTYYTVELYRYNNILYFNEKRWRVERIIFLSLVRKIVSLSLRFIEKNLKNIT